MDRPQERSIRKTLLQLFVTLIVTAFPISGWATGESPHTKAPMGATNTHGDHQFLSSSAYGENTVSLTPVAPDPPPPKLLRQIVRRWETDNLQQVVPIHPGTDLNLPGTPHPAAKHNRQNFSRTWNGRELTHPSDAGSLYPAPGYTFSYHNETYNVIAPSHPRLRSRITSMQKALSKAETEGYEDAPAEYSHTLPMETGDTELGDEPAPLHYGENNIGEALLPPELNYEDWDDDSCLECEICYQPVLKEWIEIIQSVSCYNHITCYECLSNYIHHCRGQIIILCPGHNCNTIIPLAGIFSLTGDEALINKLQENEVASAMTVNGLSDIFTCPHPNCSYVAIVPELDEPGTRDWSCPKCNKLLTFQRDSHSDQVKLVPLPSAEERELYKTAQRLIAKGTHKLCPNCITLIEKNDGCHRMACVKCKHCFCWVCQNDWGGGTENWGHGYTIHKRCNLATGETPLTIKQVVLPRPGTVLEIKNENWFQKAIKFFFRR